MLQWKYNPNVFPLSDGHKTLPRRHDKMVIELYPMNSNAESPTLIGQTGPVQGGHWTIPLEGITIGREKGCSIIIADRQVSRRHAKIDRRGGKAYLEDLASKNGTMVNGKSVRDEIELKDGDIIQIALIATLMYLASDSTMPLISEGISVRPGRIRLNPMDHNVFISNAVIDPPLSIHQYRLLELLTLRDGGLVSREDLIQAVWPGEEVEGITDQAIDALVRRLRDRLKEIDIDHEYILTIRGHGFRLENQE
jgi:DNA-binding winged helix-turn-helix (wHTH) protein